MKWTRQSFILAFVVLFVVSCTQRSEIATESYPKISSLDSKLSTIPRNINYKGLQVSPEQYINLEGTVSNAKLFMPNQPVGEITKEFTLSWRETEPKVKEFLSMHANDQFSSFYRQKCALELLCMTDLLTDSSEDALPIIGQYVNILSEEENNSIAVYYPALKRLKAYWPADKMKQVTRSVVKQAKIAVGESESIRKQLKSSRKDADQEYSDGILRGEMFYNRYINLVEEQIM